MRIAMEGGNSDPQSQNYCSLYVLMPECGMADPAKLIVVMVYDADPETGLPFAVGEPMQFDTSDKAIRVAQGLADEHAGVIAWARTAIPDLGEYGDPEILFQAGEIGDMD